MKKLLLKWAIGFAIKLAKDFAAKSDNKIDDLVVNELSDLADKIKTAL